MPIPWLLVLQTVPWTDVIRNAPKVAEGARKLWDKVSGHPAPPPTVPAAARVEHAGTQDDVVDELRARVAALEESVAALHEQMLASSELIKTLAEQNGQLVARVEANRVRVRWLTAITVVAALAAVIAFAMAR
jgi:hypothetical protein